MTDHTVGAYVDDPEFRRRVGTPRGVGLGGQPCATRIASLGHAGGKTLESEQLSNGTKEGETSKVRHVLVRSAGGLRFVYGNWSKAGEKIPTNPIVVKAGLETAAAKFIPVYFGGQESITIQRGGYAISDVISFDGFVGTVFYSHTYVKVTEAGMKWPLDLTTVSAELEGVTTTNVDRSQENVAASNARCYSPVGVVALSPSESIRVIGKVGDSIISGKEDTPIDAGWFNRALAGQYAIMSFSKGGDSAKNFAGTNTSQSRMQIMDACSHAVVAYGTNDIGAESETAAEVKTNLQAVWNRLAIRGIKVYAATLPPVPTSSDSFATVANQTVSAKKAIFDEVNAFIRETPAPLSGFIETAYAVESSPGSGKWKAPNFTEEGTHPLQAGHEAMAAAFAPANLF